MAKTVFDVLNESFIDRINSAKQHLASGSAKDYSEYRELCGLIRGLESAQRDVNDLSRHFLEDEND
jgi:hypothetical protein